MGGGGRGVNNKKIRVSRTCDLLLCAFIVRVDSINVKKFFQEKGHGIFL